LKYYILFANESDNDLWDQNTLGEESFGSFYVGLGFLALNNIIQREPEILHTLSIKDEKGKDYTVTEFLDKVEKWKIIT
tara:strand:- start:1865 stop:2101 length:237 start_codon:yes stop_codon:yes gene_type:complete